jgi:hypothetical protein
MKLNGRVARNRITKRRVISTTEWGEYLKRSPQTIVKYLKLYQEAGNSYNPHDIFSVLKLHLWFVETQRNEEAQDLPNGTGLAPTKYWGQDERI